MEIFITRVELHGKSYDEKAYEQLHAAMRVAGFSRTIVGHDGVTYHLPPAEYYLSGNYNIDTVFTLAQNAANSVTLKNAVFVSHVKVAKWDGLAPV